MIEYEEALGRILRAARPVSTLSEKLAEASGRIITSPIRAAIDLPPFDNSAMDGFAVRSRDAATPGARLHLVGESWAGAPWAGSLSENECARIATGAAIPKGADAVLMREDATELDGFVSVIEPVRPWENVRFRGEDIKLGQELARPGDRLDPQRLAILAAAGVAKVDIYRRPTVAFISTGSELRLPGETLGAGQIYESNSITLAELARRAGAETVRSAPIVDDSEQIRAAFERALSEADVVVSIGGASVGDLDLARPVLQELGADLDFWRVAIRPGKPFFFGSCLGKPVLGVPGNPVSAFVTTVLLVLPFLKALGGWEDCLPPCSLGIMAEPLANREGRRHFMRVQVGANGEVKSAGAQASHLLSSLAAANGLVEVPPNTELASGSTVKVLRW